MTRKEKLLLLTAGLIWAGCLLFIPESGALFLPSLFVLFFTSMLYALETVITPEQQKSGRV